jgi:hypothetical protein
MFYKNVNESSSDEESDDDSKLMMAATMLLCEHNSRPLHMGSVKGRATNVKRTVIRATTNYNVTTSILPSQSMMRKHSGAATRCQGSFL